MSNSVNEKQKQTDSKAAAHRLSDASQTDTTDHQLNKQQEHAAKEHGGCKGPEPTRYGDWEHNGRCTDF